MTELKTGDRVRILREGSRPWDSSWGTVGDTATVVSLDLPRYCFLKVDNKPYAHVGSPRAGACHQLANVELINPEKEAPAFSIEDLHSEWDLY